MIIKRRFVWTFDTDVFSNALSAWVDEFGHEDVAKAIGVTKQCVKAWINKRYNEGFEHPTLSNLLVVVNTLDIDPRELFSIVEAD